MEKYIDLINAYLNKSLSDSEVIAFEYRLKTDSEFNSIYLEHIVVLKGIARVNLVQEINDARQSFLRAKWLKYTSAILGTIILISIIWFSFFNNEDTAKNELREMLNFETEMIQSFNVSTDSIISLTGKKGTLIKINPKDLEYESKKPFINGNLTINLIELTNQQDLLLANTQTISNGKMLVSGGAFKIDIKTGDESLILKEGKTISVKFPKNTTEDAMQIFYGDRNEKGYLNWDLTDIQLKNEKHFTILCRDSLVLDEEKTRVFGGVETWKQILKIDTLGFLSKNEIEFRFPEILEFNEQKDTVVVYKEYYLYSERNDLDTKYEIIDTNRLKEVIEIYDENKRRGFNNSKSTSRINESYKSFYEAINISKLGWINIDKFANDEENVTINLKNNLGFNFNTYTDEAYPEDSVWHETYLIDIENNTILNVYSNVIAIPKGMNFTIISCCIVDDTFYVSRQVIKATKDDTFTINYKKRNKSQIKSLLKLETNSTEEEKPQPKIIATIKKEVEAVVVETETEFSKVSSKDNTRSFFKSNRKEPQVIKVNTEEDFKITLKEGTKISIPKNAFVNAKTGKQVSGEIDLQITEFYKLSDILLADLSTKSNGNILETGGMLYIEAKKNGSKLKLSPDKKMKIVFNNGGKPNMQLFTGETSVDGINWKLGEQIQTDVIDELTGKIGSGTNSSENEVISFQLVEEVPIYPGCKNEDNKRKCMSDAIEKLISRKFNTSLTDDFNLSGKQKITTSFEIDKEGNIGNIEVRASYKVMAEEAIRVLELLPNVIPGKQNGKAINVKYFLPIVYTVIGSENKRRTNQTMDSAVFTMKSDKGLIKRIEEKPIVLINNSDLERYTFATTKLGWINCDRFVNSRKKKIKYKIKIKDSEGANVKMVFKSISSVLPSKKMNDDYSFGNVPIDEPVILLGIKKKGDKIFLGMKHVKTETVLELDLEFKEVTIVELKTELSRLNKGF